MRTAKPIALIPGQLPLWETPRKQWFARCADCRFQMTGDPRDTDLAANRHQRQTGHVLLTGTDTC